MLRIDYAVMVVAGTLTLAGAILIAYFWIRDRLARDPGLQEFMERVEAGSAAGDGARAQGDAAEGEEARADSSAGEEAG